jgi:phospholipid transport system substrate-binding protein
MFRRRFLVLVFALGALLFTVPLQADAATEPTATQFVSDLSNGVLHVMTEKGLSESQRVAKFRTLFIGSVDLPVIGKLVLARYWRVATPDQREEFLKLFSDMLVLTWSQRFQSAAGEVEMHVVDSKPDVDNGTLVDSQILRKGQPPVSVIWRLRQPEGTFRVIDLVIDGTSMVLTYRSEYASVITQNGGRVDNLLLALRKKVAQLSSAPVQAN